MKKTVKALCAMSLCAMIPAVAEAGSAAANFNVTLTITGACTLVANPLDFGTNSGAISATKDATSTLIANCTNATPYSIGLSNGTGAGATASVRKMTNAADNSTVNYSLFTDAGRTSVWDNNCTTLPGTGTNCANGTGSGSNQTITVFGRVPAPQTAVTVGNYIDNVTATLTF